MNVLNLCVCNFKLGVLSAQDHPEKGRAVHIALVMS